MSIRTITSKRKGLRYKALVRDLNGKWVPTRTWTRKADAEKEERELLSMKDKGFGISFKPLPFDQAAEEWLGDIDRRGCSLGHRMKLRQYAKNHFLPFFGRADLKTIRQSTISGFLNHLEKKNVSANTVNAIIRALKAMFNYHIEEDNVLRNPVKKKHKSSKIDVRRKKIVWTVDEAQRFLAHADKKYSGEKRWVYLIYKIALNTGMRQGEIIALEKGDFDFPNHRIWVCKSFDYRSKKIKTVKTGKSRFVPCPPKLMEEVKSYVVSQRIFGPLFVDGKGKYRSKDTFRNIHYLRDIEEAGVRRTKFHNTRRFFNTQFVENGGSEPQLRKITGHSRLSVK